MNKIYLKEKEIINYPSSMIVFGNFPYRIIFLENKDKDFIAKNADKIEYYKEEVDSLNELFPYPSFTNFKARIEKGAIIREGVKLVDSSIILMGAVINKDAYIGNNTMIDMNVVVGSGAIIKDNVHVGASSVISGVLEPISSTPCVIENNVFIGANCVVKEGVTIHKNVIVGALSFVNKDLEEGYLYYGVPVKKIRKATKEDYEKVQLNEDLR